MPQRRSFTAIKDILGRVLPADKWESKQKQYSLFADWPNIVGPEFAKHSRPILWQGETLKVEVAHSTWLQELRMMELEILKKIRTHYPEVKIKKLRWTISSAENK